MDDLNNEFPSDHIFSDDSEMPKSCSGDEPSPDDTIDYEMSDADRLTGNFFYYANIVLNNRRRYPHPNFQETTEKFRQLVELKDEFQKHGLEEKWNALATDYTNTGFRTDKHPETSLPLLPSKPSNYSP